VVDLPGSILESTLGHFSQAPKALTNEGIEVGISETDRRNRTAPAQFPVTPFTNNWLDVSLIGV
jgi:hypothetical protein